MPCYEKTTVSKSLSPSKGNLDLLKIILSQFSRSVYKSQLHLVGPLSLLSVLEAVFSISEADGEVLWVLFYSDAKSKLARVLAH